MYGNYTPRDENRKEDNPHTPTNVPDDIEEKCHRVFEHVETWSINSGAVKYVYPKTETGYDDYEYMLDEMGFEVGNIVEFQNGTRMMVIDRPDTTVRWGEYYTVERGAVEVLLWNDEYDGKRIKFTPGDGYTPKSIWKAYIYSDIEVVGHITEI